MLAGPKRRKGVIVLSEVKIEVPSLVWPVTTRRAGESVAGEDIWINVSSDSMFEICFGLFELE